MEFYKLEKIGIGTYRGVFLLQRKNMEMKEIIKQKGKEKKSEGKKKTRRFL
jgi:hypothetical protein